MQGQTGEWVLPGQIFNNMSTGSPGWRQACGLLAANTGSPANSLPCCFHPPCLPAFHPQVEQLSASLDGERSKAASALSERASTAGELYGIREQHSAELLAERQHYERLLEVRVGVVVGLGGGRRFLLAGIEFLVC